MNVPELAAVLRAHQAADGAIRSEIWAGGRREADWNGITALVLRALRDAPDSADLRTIRQRALDFLEGCGASPYPGAFSFWTPARRPAWAEPVPADADDTAVMALELARGGRLERQDLIRIVCKTLLPHRAQRVQAGSPAWIRPGVFLTWLRADRLRVNVIDCCVNTNVVALMAYAGATHLPGFESACEMIAAGIRWAGDSPRRIRCLTPFYPHPREFLAALEHAVACGAGPLEGSLLGLRDFCERQAGAPDPEPDQPVCSSAYGQVTWAAPVLQAARRYARQL
jgi:hypothetical protein